MTREQLCCEICGFSRKKICPYENTNLIDQSGPMPHRELAHRQAAALPPSHSGQGSSQPPSSPGPAQSVQPSQPRNGTSITNNCLTTVRQDLLLPVSTVALTTKMQEDPWTGVGVTMPMVGRVHLRRENAGVPEEITVMAFFDTGSDNSWPNACLSDFASTRQPVSYQVDTMLGSA